jgi:hypothetical protein
MPRASLSPQMKKFRSFEIAITQTREEDIWSFFTTAMDQFGAKSKYYLDRIERFVEELKGYNYYLDTPWFEYADRLGLHSWMDDDYFEFWKKYAIMVKDFELCENLIWNEEDDQEKRDLMFEWANDINNFNSNIQFFNNELTYLDNKNYQEYKDKRKKKRDEKEAKKITSSDHFDNHNNSERYTEPHVENEHYYLTFGGERVYYDNTCKSCIKDKDLYFKLKYPDEKELYEFKQKEIKAIAEAEARKIAEDREREIALINLPDIVCECCDYKTKNKYEFEEHMESKQHLAKEKLKKWHCSHCGTQARSEIEWNHHITTKKHKAAIGEEEVRPTEFYCEACDYKCVMTTHWKQHCVGKKHLAKIQNK